MREKDQLNGNESNEDVDVDGTLLSEPSGHSVVLLTGRPPVPRRSQIQSVRSLMEIDHYATLS